MSYTAIGIIIFYIINTVVLIIACTTTKKRQQDLLPKAKIIPPRPSGVLTPPDFCTMPMPPVKSPLVKTDTVKLERGKATYSKEFGYIIITLNHPILFEKQEVYVSKHELDKILRELNME